MEGGNGFDIVLVWGDYFGEMKGVVNESDESSSSVSGSVFAYGCVVWDGWSIQF